MERGNVIPSFVESLKCGPEHRETRLFVAELMRQSDNPELLDIFRQNTGVYAATRVPGIIPLYLANYRRAALFVKAPRDSVEQWFALAGWVSYREPPSWVRRMIDDIGEPGWVAVTLFGAGGAAPPEKIFCVGRGCVADTDGWRRAVWRRQSLRVGPDVENREVSYCLNKLFHLRSICDLPRAFAKLASDRSDVVLTANGV
jgi:hypothetical protein